ncbi:AMP-dependent synthetase and ligase [Ferrimonas balearica DSM 9799]|uniref:Long-chain-fatty-acid--CoA ligase n=1 Tax=Ferrimonas balearica (strain DSM 9799 / CCM 4581 / KCTC 23876 / PAT) TaxID=550540 RepID=E1SML2_FERBD|nr:AMP-binding protein [Ferrimonas balearica]ADN75551.1 AMP-dependent synthetase and ligase [Ferrimonas balearica DSM 9799]
MAFDHPVKLTDAQDLASMITDTCARYADKPAFSALGYTLSFTELEAHSRAFAAYLQHHTDLQPGDRIALCLPNLLQLPIAAFGALRAGLVLVNTNPLYTPREMAHQWSDSGAKALVLLGDLAPRAASILHETAIETVITTTALDFHQSTPAAGDFDHAISFMTVLTDGASLPLKPVSRQGSDLAALQYTGGTTGVAKGAMLSHANLLGNARQVLARLGDTCREGEEVFVVPLPLYHIYAFTVNLITFFARGSLNVLIPNPRDLPAFVEQIRPFRITGMAGLNTLFVGLCRLQSFRELDFSGLKLTISGGTALTSAAAEIWQQTTGCTVSEGYGLSETSPVVCLNPIGNEQLGTIGPALIDTEVKVVDEQGQPAEEGELCVRGPQVMQGYWQMPEETALVLDADGWLKTGDIARIQDDGFVRIVDRKKDMILVSGFNVYPNEVEDVLTQFPGIVEAAVVGEADERSGERVVAYLVSEAELDLPALKAHCRENLTGYKQPRKFVRLDELPKSTVGKVLRRELRAQ